MRVSSVIRWPSSGTLKSTRTNARLPCQSISRTVYFAIRPPLCKSLVCSLSTNNRQHRDAKEGFHDQRRPLEQPRAKLLTLLHHDAQRNIEQRQPKCGQGQKQNLM